jgi:hypothetical protein
MSGVQTESLYKTQLSNRKMIEALKLTEELLPNFNRYLLSKSNSEVKQAYLEMLSNLNAILLLCNEVINSENPSTYLELVKSHRKKLKKDKNILYKPLDSIIGRLKIDQNAIGSIVNDNHSINHLCLLLIQITELLYIQYDELHQEQHPN